LKNGLQSRRKVKVERRAVESLTLQDIDREIAALASPAFRLRSRLFHREALSSCRRAVYSLLSPLSFLRLGADGTFFNGLLAGR